MKCASLQYEFQSSSLKRLYSKNCPDDSWRRVGEILEDLEKWFPLYLKINSVPIGIQCSTGSNKIWSNTHLKAVWHMGFQFCGVDDLKCFFFFFFFGQHGQIIQWKHVCWPQRTKCCTFFHKSLLWGTPAVTLMGSRQNYFQLPFLSCKGGAALL